VEEVGSMKIFAYKEHPHDYSKLSLEEIELLIEKEKERCKGKKWEELYPDDDDDL
jgi:hypothetical protein